MILILALSDDEAELSRCNNWLGLVVPIPTRCEVSIVSASAPAVLSFKDAES